MLALSTLTQAAALAAMIGIVAVLPAVIREFGMSRAQAGILATAPNIGLLLTVTVWGLSVDRLGGRWTLALGVVGAGVFTILASRESSLQMIEATLILTGIFAASAFPAGGRMVAQWFDDRRSLAMGINQAFVPVAGLLTALLLPPVAAALGWRTALVCSGLPALIAGAGYLVLYRDRAVQSEERPRTSIPRLLRSREFLLVTGAAMCFMVAQISLSSFLMPFLVQELGWSVALAGLALAIAQFGGLVGRFGWGSLTERLVGDRSVVTWKVVALLGAISAIALGRMTRTSPGLLIMAIAFVFGVACIGWNGLHIHLVADVAGAASAGMAVGISINFLQLTILVGAPSFGFAADHLGGYSAAWTGLAGVLVLGAVVLTKIRVDSNFAAATMPLVGRGSS